MQGLKLKIKRGERERETKKLKGREGVLLSTERTKKLKHRTKKGGELLMHANARNTR